MSSFRTRLAICIPLLFVSFFLTTVGCNTAKTGKPHIVFLISIDSNNYEADKTIPVFAKNLQTQQGWETTVLVAEGPRTAASFPGLKNVLDKADLLVVFARRLALPGGELDLIRQYLEKGKPLMGIRTANHAFTLLESDELPAGHEGWPEFVPDILGCLNKGYGPVEPGTKVWTPASSEKHPLLKGLPPAWHSQGNLYLVDFSVDPASVPLLMGTFDDETHPVAWTRTAGKSKVFYTSLGHPADFTTVEFEQLLINAIRWSLL